MADASVRFSGQYISFLLPTAFFSSVVAIGMTHAAGALNLAYVPLSLLVAGILLVRRPAAYLGFVLWTWTLTPLVRRMSDYQSGYHSVSIIMIAPLAVTALCVLPLMFKHSYRNTSNATPYYFYLSILAFGFFVGATQVGVSSAALGLANWALPPLFGIYVLRSPGAFNPKIETIFRSLIWITVVIGVYGIGQYIFLPKWDAYWMISSELESIGRALPYEVRVFGPLNSPGPYASFAAAGVVASFATQEKGRLPAMILGGIGLLLSLVRAAWISWLVGLLFLIFSSPSREKRKILFLTAAAAVLIAPPLVLSPLGSRIIDRIESLNDTRSDSSLISRQQLYSHYSEHLLDSLVGSGLGITGTVSAKIGGQTDSEVGTSIDSGLLEAFYDFGVLAIPLLACLLLMTGKALFNGTGKSSVAALGVAVTGLPMLFFGNTLTGASGMLIFPFLALAQRSGDLNRLNARDKRHNNMKARLVGMGTHLIRDVE